MWTRGPFRLPGMGVQDIENGTLGERVVRSSSLMSVGMIFLSRLSR